MKFTLSWLGQYLKGAYTLEDVTQGLIHIGLEVEDVADESTRLKDFKAASITQTRRHPDADRLQICTLDTGSGTLEVVCGGANARVGINVVLAPVGSIIPSTGTVLKKGNVRGVESPGMLCSKDELLLDQGGLEGEDGIIELPEDVIPGTPVSEALNLNDPVIDIAITPNRADCFAVYGIARDLHAYFTYQGKIPTTLEDRPSAMSVAHDTGKAPAIHNHVPDLCPVFGLTLLNNIHADGVKDPSLYASMTQVLRATGHKVISPLVDVTNYMCLAFGRPMHVFDADAICGDVTLKTAQGGETFEGLDDITYTLPAGALVICDDKGIISLAGIMGGKRTACTDTTRHVVVESALFDAACIARTGQALNIISDARMRFERGVDTSLITWGMAYGVTLMHQLCGGDIAGTSWSRTDTLPTPDVTLAYNHVTRVLGERLEISAIHTILTLLGFEIIHHDHTTCTVCVPTWRHDVTQAVDLIEEIVRLRGVDKIACTPLPVSINHTYAQLTDRQKKQMVCAQNLVNLGYHEVVNFSFISKAHAQYFVAPHTQESDLIHLKNPLTIDLTTMRPSLLPSLLLNVAHNQKHGVKTVALFECAHVYGWSYTHHQSLRLSGVWSGPILKKSWDQDEQVMDFFKLKAHMIHVLEGMSIAIHSVTFTPIDAEAHSIYHPGRACVIKQGRTVLGRFGELHPRALQYMDITGIAHGFELDLDAIKIKDAKYTDVVISPYPGVERDFAFIFKKDTPVGSIETALHQKLTRQKLFPKHVDVESIHIFDVFDMPHTDEKSVAVRLSFQPTHTTLTDDELNGIMHAVITCVESQTGGKLRQ